MTAKTKRLRITIASIAAACLQSACATPNPNYPAHPSPVLQDALTTVHNLVEFQYYAARLKYRYHDTNQFRSFYEGPHDGYPSPATQKAVSYLCFQMKANRMYLRDYADAICNVPPRELPRYLATPEGSFLAARFAHKAWDRFPGIR